MYYENLLKNQHLLLYSREREVSCLREQIKQMELEEDINVQFRMSEQAHNLLLGKNSTHNFRVITSEYLNTDLCCHRRQFLPIMLKTERFLN